MITKGPGDSPLYRQLADTLRECIELGRWRVGQLMPGRAHLAAEFGVSDVTVLNAMRELKQEGRVYAVRGIGTFVAPTPEAPRDVGGELDVLRERVDTLESLLREYLVGPGRPSRVAYPTSP